VLAVVRVQFVVDWANPAWVEDELVRRGARDAHLVDDDVVAVTVEAKSRSDAEATVRELLSRVGVAVVSIGNKRPLIEA
jgi:hypothetical protein